MKFKRGEWAVILFNLAYIIPFTIFYLLKEDYEFLIYIAVLVLIALIILFNFRKLNLDYLALWGLSLWGLLHMAGGGVIINGATLYKLRVIELINNTALSPDFYILKMDQFVHFYGFAVAAIVIYQLSAPHIKDLPKKMKLAIFLAFVGSMGLGALNEVVEFLAFVFVKETGVGDVYNTGFDLIFNMFGAFFGALVASWWNKRKVANKV